MRTLTTYKKEYNSPQKVLHVVIVAQAGAGIGDLTAEKLFAEILRKINDEVQVVN